MRLVLKELEFMDLIQKPQLILRIQDKNKNYLDNFGNIGGYKANETHMTIYGNPILEK